MQHPNMEKYEISFFDRFFDTEIQKNVFEWGSGWSTVRWSGKVNNWYAVDHADNWVNLVKNKCNLKTIFKCKDQQSYINKPFELEKSLSESFNVFIVDGRYRYNCIETADLLVDNDFVVFLHDKDVYPLYPNMNFISLYDGGVDLKQGGLGIYYKKENKMVAEVLKCI